MEIDRLRKDLDDDGNQSPLACWSSFCWKTRAVLPQRKLPSGSHTNLQTCLSGRRSAIALFCSACLSAQLAPAFGWVPIRSASFISRMSMLMFLCKYCPIVFSSGMIPRMPGSLCLMARCLSVKFFSRQDTRRPRPSGHSPDTVRRLYDRSRLSRDLLFMMPKANAAAPSECSFVLRRTKSLRHVVVASIAPKCFAPSSSSLLWERLSSVMLPPFANTRVKALIPPLVSSFDAMCSLRIVVFFFRALARASVPLAPMKFSHRWSDCNESFFVRAFAMALAPFPVMRLSCRASTFRLRFMRRALAITFAPSSSISLPLIISDSSVWLTTRPLATAFVPSA
mmetsp:Transcript_37960/g.73538  ORF Transcript_37960/g.73538 Transcript_37960/m.73538 type:complete len:339 (+) Transcript_37960:275-1291(+)